MVDPAGKRLATFDDLVADGDGYRLHVARPVPAPLRLLLVAAPIVRYFFHQS